MNHRENLSNPPLLNISLLRLSLIMGSFLIAVTGAASVTTTTNHIHDPENVVSGNAEFVR